MAGKGYSGIIVTDHFFNGNTCIPEDLPWEQRVEMYCAGYERAKKAAEGMDFNVMFGVEFNFQKDEYLLYGIDKEWLIKNERIMHMTRHQLHDAVSKAGAIMVQAHPYRERDYLTDIKLCPEVCDGIEIYNAANSPNMNALGYKYAADLDLPMTSGSDIHFFHEKYMGGMMFEEKIGSVEEYVEAVLNRKGVPVRLSPQGDITPVKEIKEETVITAPPSLPVIFPEGI